jgi:O-antigen ligase
MYGVIVIGAVLALLADGRARAAAQWALAVLGVLALGFVILTGTRGAIVGLVVLAFLGISAAWRSGRARAFGAALVLLVSVAVLSPAIRIFLDESIRVDEPSTSAANVVGRLALTKRMLDVFASNPALGVGPGYFQKVVDAPGEIDTEGLGGIENQYATLLAENGIVGCLLFVAFLVILVKRGRSQEPYETARRGTLVRWSGAAVGAIGIMGISAFVLTTVPMFHALVLGGTCLASTGGGEQ